VFSFLAAGLPPKSLWCSPDSSSIQDWVGRDMEEEVNGRGNEKRQEKLSR